MPSGVYTRGKYLIASGLGWDSSALVVRALLVGTGYTFAAAHQFVSDVVGSEVSDASYSRVTVTNRASSIDLGGGRALLDADDILFPDLDGVTVGGVVIYKQFGGDDTTPGSDPLICFIEVSPSITPGGSSLLIELNTDGLVQLL